MNDEQRKSYESDYESNSSFSDISTDKNPVTPYMQAYKLLIEQHERQMRTHDLLFKMVFCFAAILLTFTCYLLMR